MQIIMIRRESGKLNKQLSTLGIDSVAGASNQYPQSPLKHYTVKTNGSLDQCL